MELLAHWWRASFDSTDPAALNSTPSFTNTIVFCFSVLICEMFIHVASFFLLFFFQLKLQNSIYKILRFSLLKEGKRILSIFICFFNFVACFKKSLYSIDVSQIGVEKNSDGVGSWFIGMVLPKYIPKDVYVCVRIALDGINLWPLRLYFLFSRGSAEHNLFSRPSLDSWETIEAELSDKGWCAPSTISA